MAQSTASAPTIRRSKEPHSVDKPDQVLLISEPRLIEKQPTRVSLWGFLVGSR
jgi:hypothetical protein